MEASEKRTKEVVSGLILAVLPLIIFISNAILLRFTGQGFTYSGISIFIQPAWVLMGLCFPLWLCPKNSIYFLRHLGFFAICLGLSLANYIFPSLIAESTSAFAAGGIFILLSTYSGFAPTIVITLAGRFILNLSLNLKSLTRIFLFNIIYLILLNATTAEARVFREAAFGEKYVYIFLLGSLIVLEHVHASKKETLKLLLKQTLCLLASIALAFGLQQISDSLSLKSGLRYDSKVSVPVELNALTELSKAGNLEKLKAHLVSSPVWKVGISSNFTADRRVQEGSLYIDKSIYGIERSARAVVTITIREKKSEFPEYERRDVQFQKVDPQLPVVEALVFEARFGKWDNRKDLNIEVTAGPVELRFSESSKEKYGELLKNSIAEIKKELEGILPLTVEQIIAKNAVKGDEAGKCFYQSSVKDKHLQVWGYVNAGEPGKIGIAVNGVAEGYNGEAIGWSSNPKEGFFFEDGLYMRNLEKPIENVELRYYADSKNDRYGSGNYSVLTKCEPKAEFR